MARKKTAKPKKKAEVSEAEETIILDGNVPTPQLKVDAPVESSKPKWANPDNQPDWPAEDAKNTPLPTVNAPAKDDPMTVVADDIKALRPDDVYGPEEETSVEMGDRLQDRADRYKVELDEISDADELKKLEDEWIKKLEKMDEYLKKVSYFLPNRVEFNKKLYPKSYVAGRIVKFLQSKEVKFQFTLGMWEMCKLWLADPAFLNYSQYNGTLETLGTMTFKGMSEWENILIINEFFRKSNKEYAKDITAYQYLSTMHSHVVGRMQMLDPSATNAQ